MRDPKRIKKFCDELAEIWENQCPDWRFGQLICNVIGEEIKRDPFYIEEGEMMESFRRFFHLSEGSNENGNGEHQQG